MFILKKKYHQNASLREEKRGKHPRISQEVVGAGRRVWPVNLKKLGQAVNLEKIIHVTAK